MANVFGYPLIFFSFPRNLFLQNHFGSAGRSADSVRFPVCYWRLAAGQLSVPGGGSARYSLCGRGVHWVNGSPVKPLGQLQIGLWLRTRQSAPAPQLPGHGSRHFWPMQAWSVRQSWWMTHSGRQLGARPMKPGRQEQTARPPSVTVHCELAPHGLGWHGFTGSACVTGGTETEGARQGKGSMIDDYVPNWSIRLQCYVACNVNNIHIKVYTGI